MEPMVLGSPYFKTPSYYFFLKGASKLNSMFSPHQQCHQDSMDARAITSLREGRDGAGKPRSAWGGKDIPGNHRR